MGQNFSSRFRPATLAGLATVLLSWSACWIVLFVLFPAATQNFPLLDDWAYSRAFFAFLHGDGLQYLNWAAVPQLGQWLWALPFVAALGASHVALRLSTIVLALLGVIAFYDLLRQQRCSPARAAFAAAVLAFQPLFLALSATFMSDVPALSLCLISLALAGRALARGRLLWLVLSSAVAVLAVLTRQNAIVAPLVIGYFVSRPDCPFRRNSGWWACVLLPIVIGLGICVWFESRTDVRRSYPAVPAPELLLSLPYWTVQFCGLAAAPALLLLRWRGQVKPLLILFAVMGGFAVYWLAIPHSMADTQLFPYSDTTILGTTGFGEPGMYLGTMPVVLRTVTRDALTALGCLAGAALLVRLWARRNDWRQSPLLLFTAVQAALLFFTPIVYDRHFLFLIPGVLAVVCVPAAEEPGFRWLPATATLAVVAGVSFALMHDWFSWNRALWALGRQAVAELHIPPAEIEGGIEWDGWYSAGALRLAKGEYVWTTYHPRWAAFSVIHAPWTKSSLWRLHTVMPDVPHPYGLAFCELPLTKIIARQPYSLWLCHEDRPAWRRHQILLLQFADDPQTHPSN